MLIVVVAISINFVQAGSISTPANGSYPIVTPPKTINYSLVPSVNNSIYWNGHAFVAGAVSSIESDPVFGTWLSDGELCTEGTACGFISDGNTLWDNVYGFITSWLVPSTTNGWLYNDSTYSYFNESKLSSKYYNATQLVAIAGTINGGTLADVGHTDGDYDGITFNFTEASGSPGLDLRMNFTGITDFNKGIMRYKTSTLAGAYPIIQVWNYDASVWEDYPYMAQSLNFATIEQSVFDDDEHVGTGASAGVVQMRLYKASNGNTKNKYYVDWVAIVSGFGTPSGEEIDPYSVHTDGTKPLTGNWDMGMYNLTNGNLTISQNSTIINFNTGGKGWCIGNCP